MAMGYKELKTLLKKQILSGELKQGERLPSGKVLSEQFNVSYVTTDRALRELAKEGLVSRARQKGTFVKSQVANESKGAIALFVPAISPQTTVANMLIGIEEIVTQNDYELVVMHTHGDSELALNKAKATIERGVKGVIYAPFGRDKIFERNAEVVSLFQNESIPVVVAGHCEMENTAPFSYVSSDHYNAAREVVRHLISLGHEQIAVISGHLDSNSKKIVNGFRDELESQGVGVNPSLICSCDSQESVGTAVRMLLNSHNSKPTAFFGVGDDWAAKIIMTLGELGLKVPEDVAVIGFGDHPFCEYVNPPLTTVKVRHYEEGQLLASTLLNEISDGVRKQVEIELPCQIIVRQSCGALSMNRVVGGNLSSHGEKKKPKRAILGNTLREKGSGSVNADTIY